MGALSFLGLGSAERPPLQLYGKLPIAKDYLRVGCSQGGGLELRTLLDRTFGSTRAGEDELVLHEPLRFSGFSEREPLQGCIWPSSDAGGHRRFPFALFVERKKRALVADFANGAVRAEAVWRALVGEYEACLACSDGRELLEARRSGTFDVESFEPVPGAAVDLSSWLGALWPDERERGFAALLAELARHARTSAAFRLPLTSALPMRDQLLAWRRVLEHLGALQRDSWPTIALPFAPLMQGNTTVALVVVVGRFAEEHVAWLAAGREQDLGPGDCMGLVPAAAPDEVESLATDLTLAHALEPLLGATPGTRS